MSAPFGRVLTAMVTPFTADGGLDVDGAQRLAATLVDAGNDGLVINGTTGESPTTTDEEKSTVLRAVVDAVGDRAHVLAGVGTFATAHTVELARQAEKAGAEGLLVVSPYYSRPPQDGLLVHFRTVADATDLPVMLYDIPARTGVALESETLLRLGEHPRIVAVKDAKDSLAASSRVIARSDLAYYCGSDMFNLPLLAVGAVGFVSTVGHFVAAELAELIRAHDAGDVAAALAIHQRLLPVYDGVFRRPNPILVKAGLTARGLPGGPVRPPLPDATDEQLATLREDFAAAGISL
jgi:4-hydroxy-tetrahydrodipicolinate synthase